MPQPMGLILASALTGVADLSSRAASLKTACQAGTVSAAALQQFHDRLQDAYNLVKPILTEDLDVLAAANIPPADRPENAGALLVGVRTAGAAVAAWMQANLPADKDGFVPGFRLDGDTGRSVAKTFTAEETSGLVTLLDDLISASR